jgi:RND superfamily putative drug exporter
MLDRLAHLTYVRRRTVLVAAAVFVAIAVGWGTGVFGQLVGGGFQDPGSDSSRETTVADSTFGRDEADVVVVYRSADRTVDDASYRAAVTATLNRLPRSDVRHVTTYWTAGPQAAALVSADRHSTYAVLQMAGADDTARQDSYDAVKDQLAAPGLQTYRGGAVPLNETINDQVKADIGRAEGTSLPILLLLLVVVFGGLAAASLPLAIGGLAILGAFTALRVISLFTDVSVYAINIVTMLGLGLAIDYGLFVVSRFREELALAGGDRAAVEPALRATVRTAGRTVLFSGLTVAVALSSLMLFPLPFLRSMGYGGVAAVVVAMVGALTVLPALLAVLGPRVDAFRLPVPGFLRRAPRTEGEVVAHGPWYRLATSVMKRPVLYVVTITIVLVAMGLPFLHVRWGSPDHRVLPSGTEARVAGELLDSQFPASRTRPVDIVVTLDRPVAAATAELAAYDQRLGQVPGVTAVQVSGESGRTARLTVAYEQDPVSPEGRQLVSAVRDVTPPAGASVLVGGFAAQDADTLSALGGTLPWAGLWIVAGMLVLLFLAFGSVVLPIKAVLMNVLSLTAAFGAVVWVFQEGHLSGPLGFTSVGSVEATQPVLMFAMAFGLAMDYEVFLLSRVREEWDRTHDNTRSVALGLERTGRIITSAALLLIVVIGSFATSGVTFIKMIGVGLALAVLVDATVVRALLVPATMRLLGRVNWWAPAPLRRVYERFGLRESDTGAPATGPASGSASAPAYATMEG